MWHTRLLRGTDNLPVFNANFNIAMCKDTAQYLLSIHLNINLLNFADLFTAACGHKKLVISSFWSFWTCSIWNHRIEHLLQPFITLTGSSVPAEDCLEPLWHRKRMDKSTSAFHFSLPWNFLVVSSSSWWMLFYLRVQASLGCMCSLLSRKMCKFIFFHPFWKQK
jgi:hypothetical protein